MRFCETIKQSLPIAGVLDIELKGFKRVPNGLPNVRVSERAFCGNCNTFQKDVGNGCGRLPPIPFCTRDPCLQALGRAVLCGHDHHRRHRPLKVPRGKHPDGEGTQGFGRPGRAAESEITTPRVTL
jgi:hypothetical protein